MDSERWQRINQLFGAALEVEPDERAGFLIQACPDEALRAEVESLLDAHSRAGGFIERPAFTFGSQDSARPTPGRRFGPYEVIGLLGRGGMGEVYRARDPRLDREVAIKTLPRGTHSDAASLGRLELEARAAGSLNHPNIVAVYDVGNEDGMPYVVSELLEGETLQARLRRAALHLAETLRLAGQLASGLEAAHAKGIVHRDLKPANLFLVADGRLKILDFGLAKRHLPLAGATPGYTQPGVVLGTVGYMAPEQVRGLPVDPRSDVFSYGAVLYEMLSGWRAFTGGSPVEIMGAILHDEPPALGEHGVPAPVAALVRRCLSKSPADRFSGGAALLTALTALTRDLASAAPETIAELGGHPPPADTLAVLPFVDLAGGPDNVHLGLGLADATIGELARLPGLVVRPTSAILRFAGRQAEPRQVADELRVDSLVVGTFQRAGDRLRVSVQLLTASDSRTLWATRIDTSLDDLFALQDEVSRQVARALELRFSSGAAPRPRHAPGGEVYELYLKGRVNLFQESLEACLTAVDCLDQACARDPDFALGWAGLADAYSRIAFTFLPEGDWYTRAWTACERALAIDPDLPEARYVRGGRLLWSPQRGFDHAGALADLVPALAARPGLEEAHVRLGVILHHIGLIDEVEVQLEQALLASPGHALARQHLGLVRYTRGDFAEALDIYRAAQSQVPSPWIHHAVALCQLQLSRDAEAEATVEAMQRQAPRDPLAHPLLGLLAARRGDRDEARRQLRLTEERRREYGHFHHAEYDLGCVLALLGESEEAVSWLRRAADNGFPCAPQFRADPLLASLAGNPSFAALLRDLETRRRAYAALYDELRLAG